MKSLARFTVVVATVLGALTAPITAQLPCNFGDDGLANVPCCAPAQTNLPPFPSFQISGSYACFKDCGVEATFPVRVTTFHIPILCDLHLIQIMVFPGVTGSPGYSGIVAAKYARTWWELDSAGLRARQVWRFLINGDLNNNAGAMPCPVPPHAAGTPTNFHGHIDYACETDATGAPVFSMLLNLNHLPGCIEHNMFSCAPAVGAAAHLDRSYHLVAPGSFAFGPAAPVVGPLAADAVRSTAYLPIYTCLGEGRVLQGNVTPVSVNCLCVTPPPGTQPWTHDTIFGTAGCMGLPASFSSVPVGPPLPPLPSGTTQLPIGMWTGAPGTFPGSRELTAHWGVLLYPDPCNTAHPPYHIVHGVSTANAFGVLFTTVTPPPVYRVFTDLADMINTGALTGGPIQPTWGCLFLSKMVWSLNIP